MSHKNFNAEFHEGQYDQLDQEIISGNENVKIQQSDLVIICADLNTKLLFNPKKVDLI